MAKGLAEATAAEEAAVNSYGNLMAATKQEVIVLTKAVETKVERIGSLGVEVAQMKNKLGDTEEELIADKQFLAKLEKSCVTKSAEWDESVKPRPDELAALADTIRILNDDHALEKKSQCSSKPHANQGQHHRLADSCSGTAPEVGQSHSPWKCKTRPHHVGTQGQQDWVRKHIKMIDDLVATLVYI